MIINLMDRKEMEQAIADKLNELANLISGWHGHDANEFTFGISDKTVWGYIYNKDGENPLDFSKPRKYRKADRLFTPDLGEIIGKAAKASLLNNDDNPLCWASDEGVELMRQKLVFMLQEHDLMEDLKESGTTITIEPVVEEEKKDGGDW